MDSYTLKCPKCKDYMKNILVDRIGKGYWCYICGEYRRINFLTYEEKIKYGSESRKEIRGSNQKSV